MEVWHAGFIMSPHRQLVYVLLALVLLLGYNRYAGLHPDSTWAEVAIGVSVGTAQLGGNDGVEETGMVDKHEVAFGGQLTLAVCGAVLFAANVAPTEEIILIGIELPGYQLAGLGLATMALGALILFYSDFLGARRWVRAQGFGSVLRGGVITYAVGLVTSAAILWLFGRFDGVGPAVAAGQCVALGVASTIGASAGRLLLQGAGGE